MLDRIAALEAQAGPGFALRFVEQAHVFGSEPFLSDVRTVLNKPSPKMMRNGIRENSGNGSLSLTQRHILYRSLQLSRLRSPKPARSSTVMACWRRSTSSRCSEDPPRTHRTSGQLCQEQLDRLECLAKENAALKAGPALKACTGHSRSASTLGLKAHGGFQSNRMTCAGHMSHMS